VQHPSISRAELFKEKLMLVYGDENATLDELKEMPMLVFKPGCNYRRNLERWLSDEKVEGAAIVEFGTLETILGSIKSGLGISLVPESTVKSALERGELFGYELSAEYSEISTDFIWHKETYMTTAMNKFIQTVQEYRDENVF